MKEFVLTKNHINHGPSEQDITAYAGYPVFLLGRDSPYWNEIRHGGLVLKAEKATMPADGDDPLIQQFKAAAHAAVAPWRDMALGQFETNTQAIFGGARHVVFPYAAEPVEIEGYALNMLGVGMLPSAGTAVTDMWPILETLSQRGLSSVRFDEDASLLAMLRLMRQTRQVELIAGASMAPDYYAALDADLFARGHHKKAELSADSRLAHLCARYLNILDGEPRDWIAPAIDRIESGQAVPAFAAIEAAVTEIRCRLVAEAYGIDQRKLSAAAFAEGVLEIEHSGEANTSEKLGHVAAAYQAWGDIRQQPEVPCSMLKQLAEASVLTPLSQWIAGKIIMAAHCFDPGLTQESHPRARAKLPLLTPG